LGALVSLKNKRVLLIGGGIVGLATALKLKARVPGCRLTLVEKEDDVGRHQSGHNSGVLHCGLYYKPGSAKARLAVSGIQEMMRFCQEHDIPHDVCGKLVVACNEEEVARLKKLKERGTENGLKGLKWLELEAMREIEPHVGGIAALRVPQEGIVDYPRVCTTMARLVRESGTEIVTGARVDELLPVAGLWRASTTAGDFEADWIINCAGLHCDRVSQLAGQRREVRVVPFRGEFYKLRKDRQQLVRHLIYPTPDPAFPFLGVHFTRMIGGGIEAGPNAVLAFAREGYRLWHLNPRDLADALTFGGLWRFLLKYPHMAVHELRGSFSKAYFCRNLSKLVPEITPDDLVAGGTGVRAQAMAPAGELVHDFHFVRGHNALHVLNAPSPAATASLAIGTEIADQILN
jgi:L-2-hydroxyglutarate oxidase